MSANKNFWSTSGIGVILVVTALVALAACGARDETAPPGRDQPPQPTEVATEVPTPQPVGFAPLVEPWKGDLDGMVERRIVRILTVHSPVQYFVDRGRELGITYESGEAFETYLNEKLGTGHVKVHVLVMPVGRDELIPRLLAGQGDIAAAN